MKSFLINGCYDRATLQTLKDLGIQQLGFDLRGASPNLVPFFQLKELLPTLEVEEVSLIFEDDRPETVRSFLNLLGPAAETILLQFRDQQVAKFYHDLDHPFTWMFHPDADWKAILSLPTLDGVLLPLTWKEFYEATPELWTMIEKRALDVHLHAKNFEEALSIEPQAELMISVDLTLEIEKSFRSVDQDRLKKLKIWRRHEPTIIE